LDEAKNGLAEITTLIADLKAGKIVGKAPSGKPGDKTEKNDDQETLENVEKSLDENQRKVVETAFMQLSNAEKLQYDSDPEFRLLIFKRAQEAAPVIPGSPWKTAQKSAKPEDKSGYKTILDRIFDKKRQKSYVPSGPHGGAPVLGSESDQKTNEPPEDTRVH
jgi:hypothetical protein